MLAGITKSIDYKNISFEYIYIFLIINLSFITQEIVGYFGDFLNFTEKYELQGKIVFNY